MLDIVLFFILICHLYCCHRDNEQFRVHVDVNCSYVNFVMRWIIQKNRNTKMFLMCYNACDYYFGHCSSLWESCIHIYIYIYIYIYTRMVYRLVSPLALSGIRFDALSQGLHTW